MKRKEIKDIYNNIYVYVLLIIFKRTLESVDKFFRVE